MSQSAPGSEPADHHVYDGVLFSHDLFRFYLAALRFYEARLEDDLKLVREDPDLRNVLDDEVLDSYRIAEELRRVKHHCDWLTDRIENRNYHAAVSHDWVRFIKSVSLLYLDHLQRRRHAIASKSVTAKGLEAVDRS